MINRMLPAAAALALFAAVPAAHGQDAETILSEANAIAPIVLAVGETAILRLQSNPSTGYGWQVVETLNLRVEEPFEVVRGPAAGEPVVGAPGTALIRISARTKGPAALRLIYTQPWRAPEASDPTLYFVFTAE